MPSNKSLIERVVSLSEQLGISVVNTSNLKNSELVALVSDLKIKIKDTEVGPAPVEDTGVGPAPEPTFYVPEGRAITSKRGILADGAEVKAEYFPGGQETLDNLVKSGHIKKG